jgi:hypothetical protein
MGNPTVTPLVEALHDGGFIVSVGNGHQSFDQVTLTGGAKVLAGAVLGVILAGLTAAAAALGTNTGNGTFGAITLTTVATEIGTYDVAFTDATHYTVTAPDGSTSTGTTGVAFAALGIGFTITAGGTPMVAGDGFTITTANAVGKPTIASAAKGGNTGNATVGTLTANGYAPSAGFYSVEFDDATHYVVADPLGALVGHGTTGVAFSGGGLGFTITAGGTAFVPGDSFVVTVASGSGKYKAWSPAAVDGSQVPAAILFATTDVTNVDKQVTVVARQAEVNQSELIFPTGMSAAQIASCVAQLKNIGILAR